MTYLAALIAVAAVMLLAILYAAVTAPEGWEDSDGFHVRRDDCDTVFHNDAGAA